MICSPINNSSLRPVKSVCQLRTWSVKILWIFPSALFMTAIPHLCTKKDISTCPSWAPAFCAQLVEKGLLLNPIMFNVLTIFDHFENLCKGHPNIENFDALVVSFSFFEVIWLMCSLNRRPILSSNFGFYFKPAIYVLYLVSYTSFLHFFLNYLKEN